MTSSVFPDINVWIALSLDRHVHHPVARQWFDLISPDAAFWFCRFTQLGFLRLLGNPAVVGAGSQLSQRQAWGVYDQWLLDDRVAFCPEPPGLDAAFRALTQRRAAAAKDWADSYLAAFAGSVQATLITFDKALSSRVPGSVCLSDK